MDEAEQCDSLAFILDGALIAQGAPPDLKENLASRLFEALPACDPFDALSAIVGDPALEDAYLHGIRLRAVSRPGQGDRGRQLLAATGPVEQAEPTLEDVFVSLARQRAGALPQVTS
jgi:ABC-2 type transport system ATP-binding protein